MRQCNTLLLFFTALLLMSSALMEKSKVEKPILDRATIKKTISLILNMLFMVVASAVIIAGRR